MQGTGLPHLILLIWWNFCFFISRCINLSGIRAGVKQETVPFKAAILGDRRREISPDIPGPSYQGDVQGIALGLQYSAVCGVQSSEVQCAVRCVEPCTAK